MEEHKIVPFIDPQNKLQCHRFLYDTKFFGVRSKGANVKSLCSEKKDERK